MAKRICILGSTGSVGAQAVEVAQSLDGVAVVGLAAHKNISLLKEQIDALKPLAAAVADEEAARALAGLCVGSGTDIMSGSAGVAQVAAMAEADVVVNALVGSAGLLPTVAALKAGKSVALANKETLVAAGVLVTALAEKRGARLIPVDSEHSAIAQCLAGNEGNPVRTIYLTASGGPFRGKKRADLAGVTVSEALAHPNWRMGAKISVDSATMMNKGLEVIEARWLFGVPAERIQVLVHPQSVVHSMVEFEDGAVMAQLGEADMRLPIAYALTAPARKKNSFKRVDFFRRNTLTFEPPDMDAFPCLALAYDALAAGGAMPAVLNGANEMAVELFLRGRISFLRIPELIESAMDAYTVQRDCTITIDDVVKADAWAKANVLKRV